MLSEKSISLQKVHFVEKKLTICLLRRKSANWVSNWTTSLSVMVSSCVLRPDDSRNCNSHRFKHWFVLIIVVETQMSIVEDFVDFVKTYLTQLANLIGLLIGIPTAYKQMRRIELYESLKAFAKLLQVENVFEQRCGF